MSGISVALILAFIAWQLTNLRQWLLNSSVLQAVSQHQGLKCSATIMSKYQLDDLAPCRRRYVSYSAIVSNSALRTFPGP